MFDQQSKPGRKFNIIYFCYFCLKNDFGNNYQNTAYNIINICFKINIIAQKNTSFGGWVHHSPSPGSHDTTFCEMELVLK